MEGEKKKRVQATEIYGYIYRYINGLGWALSFLFPDHVHLIFMKYSSFLSVVPTRLSPFFQS